EQELALQQKGAFDDDSLADGETAGDRRPFRGGLAHSDINAQILPRLALVFDENKSLFLVRQDGGGRDDQLVPRLARGNGDPGPHPGLESQLRIVELGMERDGTSVG